MIADDFVFKTADEAILSLQTRIDDLERTNKGLEKREEKRRSDLFKAMMDAALGGNVTMQIWLSRQMLGFGDQPK